MTAQTYDYNGIIAEYWDLLRGNTSKWSSRPYFLKLIQESGQPALDVACGTGRLLFVATAFLTWYTVEEALALLQATGFETVQAHADFTFDPAAEDETSFIVLGKRP